MSRNVSALARLSATSYPSPRPTLAPLLGEHHELLGGAHHVLGEALLQSRLDGEELGLRHHAPRSTAARTRCRQRSTRSSRRWRLAPARTRPQRSSSQSAKIPPPCSPDAVAAHLAAAAREHVDLRIQLRIRELDVLRRSLDARGGHPQVRVVRDRLGDQRVEPRSPNAASQPPATGPVVCSPAPQRSGTTTSGSACGMILRQGSGATSSAQRRQRAERSDREDLARACAWLSAASGSGSPCTRRRAGSPCAGCGSPAKRCV